MKCLIKIRVVIPILFAAVLSFVGCNQINIEKELLSIDSLQTILGQAKDKAEEIDIDAIKIYKETMAKQVNLIKIQYSDSIEWETAKFLNRYHAIKKSFSKYVDKNVLFEDELEYSNAQLKNLKHDLIENIIPLDSFKINYAVELQAVKDLKSLIHREVDNLKNTLEKYQEANPKIEALLKKLEGAKDSISD